METTHRLTIVTGNGKGKTTSGLGRAVMAALSGERVLVIQFLKGTGYTGELKAAGHWNGRLAIRQFGSGCFQAAEIGSGTAECSRCGTCFRENRRPENRFALQAFECAREAVESAQWELLVLDEISHALNRGLLELPAVIRWTREVAGRVGLVMTGRNMPPELMEMADWVTECRAVKHPAARGILGRRGIEY